MSHNKFHPSQSGGSVMIAALIITLITGSLVGLFLKTVTQEVHNSHRFRMGFQAINLAEAGLEFAIDAMRNDNFDTRYWEEGTDGFLARNVPNVRWYTNRNEIRTAWVYVQPGSDPPLAVAEGKIRLPNGMEVSRQIWIAMGDGQNGRKSLFANGVVAKDLIDFSGNNVYVDSYSSSQDVLNVTTRYANRDNGSVATVSIIDSSLGLGNGDVFGRIATGGGNPDIGPNGKVFGNDTPFGVSVDTNRIARDFSGTFPDPVVPDTSSALESYSGSTIGSSGQTTLYKLPSLELSGKESVSFEGDVTIVITGDLEIGGKAFMEVAENSSVKLYVAGDATISGNGMVNHGEMPKNFMLYGTGKDSGQEIKVAGNGAFFGVVYAPDYDISARGGGANGTLAGAVVGKTVKFTGNTNFHYDEDLAGLIDDTAGANDSKDIEEWVELTEGTDRVAMASVLTNGL